jgi:microcystin-dependent protein
MPQTVLFANNASTALAGGITNVATTANLTTGSGALFPSPDAGQYFVATFTDAATGLLREIVHVTAVSGDAVTMVRAQEGTTALAWDSGDFFVNQWTAGQAAAMQQIADLIATVTSFNTRTGAVTMTSGDVTTALGFTPASADSATPTGAVFDMAASTVPAGYLECTGAAISRTTYAALFAVIGVIYGSGDGSTTFNIPDYRGYFRRGWSHGSSVDSGRAIGTLQADAFQGHIHSIGGVPTVGSGFGYSGSSGVTGATITQTGSPISDGTSGTPRTATETRPVNISVMTIIKT